MRLSGPRRSPGERLSTSEWLADHGGTVLVTVGVASVAASLFVDSETKAVPLIVMGLAAVILGVVLPRVEGQMKLGPSGLEVVLAKVRQKAAQRGLPPDAQAKAIDAARREWAHYQALLAASTRSGAHPSESIVTSDEARGAEQAWVSTFDEAAEEVAESILHKTTRVLCGQCGYQINERSDTPADERTPCPNCGSTSRTFEK